MQLTLKRYQTCAEPQNDMVGKITCVCDEFSYSFSNGTYFLTGEVDSGAWSFADSLICADNKISQYTSYEEIALNGKNVDLSEVQKMSFSIGQYKTYGEKKFESILKHALKKSKSTYTVEDICKKFDFFGIDEWLKNQKMSLVNTKIWYLSAAIGLAMGKKIFVFPWLSNRTFRLYHGFIINTIHILNQEDLLVFVPCSDKADFPTGEKYNVVRMNSLYQVDFDNFISAT